MPVLGGNGANSTNGSDSSAHDCGDASDRDDGVRNFCHSSATLLWACLVFTYWAGCDTDTDR